MKRVITVLQSGLKESVSNRIFNGTSRAFNSTADRAFQRLVRKPQLRWLQNQKRFKLVLSTKPFQYHEAEMVVRVDDNGGVFEACSEGTRQAIGTIPKGTKRIYAYVQRPKERF